MNGRAHDPDDTSGGCLFMGQDASLHLSNVTFRNCSAAGMKCMDVCVWEAGDTQKQRDERR